MKKGELQSSLQLGPLRATAAGENAAAAVEYCVRAALDYFRRTDGSSTPERIAHDRLAEALADDARRLFVLTPPDGPPCGLLDLALDWPEPGEVTLALLVLAHQERGRGLGREVVGDLIALLRNSGYRTLRLGVAPGEEAAARFWSSVGLSVYGRSKGVHLFELSLESS